MTQVSEPLSNDKDLENLLEQIAEANPDADTVKQLVYQGQSFDLIEVHGVNDEEIQLPDETHGFELEVPERWFPESEEARQKLVDEGVFDSIEELEPPFEPAMINFNKTTEGDAE
ncbi:hypothetical protein OB919_15935 [Halobacteria archaeon AArc-curdl1]|uniref:Uncharacterized protein n=1 Tax=Natronosalvus hydrolyticus TaxID=2979988 RepID=A0AAP2ZB04_9EURY|nr:hypothetical protein [Halobacteria archaeon AArc-curdl1]